MTEKVNYHFCICEKSKLWDPQRDPFRSSPDGRLVVGISEKPFVCVREEPEKYRKKKETREASSNQRGFNSPPSFPSEDHCRSEPDPAFLHDEHGHGTDHDGETAVGEELGGGTGGDGGAGGRARGAAGAGGRAGRSGRAGVRGARVSRGAAGAVGRRGGTVGRGGRVDGAVVVDKICAGDAGLVGKVDHNAAVAHEGAGAGDGRDVLVDVAVFSLQLVSCLKCVS